MPFISLGFGFLAIWALNWIWISQKVIETTPEDERDGADESTIINNFMRNTPIETIQFMAKLQQISPWLFLLGMTMFVLAFIF